jgi:hypothetical protein
MDHNELTNQRVHAIARAHDCTIDAVHQALDRHPIELDRDAYLRRTLALELMRLDQLEMAFESKAIKDRDAAAGALMVKILERRSTLLGLNPSPGFAVQVVQHPPAQQQTTTDEMLEALNWVRQQKPQLPDPQSNP